MSTQVFENPNLRETIVRGPGATRTLGAVRVATPESVAVAVGRARDASREWARSPLSVRTRILDEAAACLRTRAGELGELLAAESGKPIAQALFEVNGAIGLLIANAAAARQATGTVLPTDANPGTEDDIAFTRREPLGVVGAILPFNFPAELFVEKCAAALVAGNTVVAKPPAEDPLTVVAFAEALWEAGVPRDVLAICHGGAEVGAALVEADGLSAVSLTGSTKAGVSVARSSARELRRLHLELGGNNACLVFDDADLALAAREIEFGRLMMNGQACSATKRVLVHRPLHGALAEALAAAANAQTVGDASAEETTVGPLITSRAAERVSDQVARAEEQGAQRIAGSGSAEGPFFSPVVLADVPTAADIACDDEVFGPVFALIPVDSEDEAIEVANRSSYGLMASVFTSDLGRGLRAAERLEAGGVVINGSDNYRPPVIPFGGVKRSGLGREGAGYTLEEMTVEKTIVLRRVRRDRSK